MYFIIFSILLKIAVLFNLRYHAQPSAPQPRPYGKERLMHSIFLKLFAPALLVAVCACTVNSGGSQADPATQSGDSSYTAESASFYYDFDDILVPREMELDIEESFIVETPETKSGLMVFNGMVEIRSLTDFFINSMVKDNWVMRSVFRSNRTILVFDKDARTCVMNITNERYNTLLEIWVSPNSQSSGGY